MDYDPRLYPNGQRSAPYYGQPGSAPYGGYPPTGQPSGYPYGGSGVPPYQPFVPPTDNHKPLLVTVSRPLNALQYQRMLRQTHNGRMLVPWILFGLSTILFFVVVMAFRLYTKNWQTLVFLLVNFIGFCGAGVNLLLRLRANNATIRQQAEALVVGNAGEGKIEVYGNRVVSYTAHAKTTLYYSQVEALTETPDMVGISGEGKFVAWRAQDLSPGEARLLLTCLTYYIRPGCYRRSGALMPMQPQPSQPPEESAAETVWLTVETGDGVPLSFGAFLGRILRRQAGALYPLWILLAGILAIYQFVTPHLLMDMAMYIGLVGLGGAGLLIVVDGLLFALGRTRPADEEETDALVFIPDGLIVRRGEDARFIDKRFIQPRAGKKGVTLRTPWGDYRIPWGHTDRDNTLKAILSL